MVVAFRRLDTVLAVARACEDNGDAWRDRWVEAARSRGRVGAAATAVARPTPAELPHDVRGFVGRDDELAGLTALSLGDPHTGSAVVIMAIDGTPGVGKTALAVRWAHQVADRFPDGQLFVSLRGHHPQRPPLPAEEALDQLLRALRAAPGIIPAGLDEQTRLYRSMLNGKRALIVLDDATSANQVRPLLPGDPGCLVLVTSRSTLTSLVAREGAHQLTIDVLAPDESVALLAGILGVARVDVEPGAAAELSRLCGHLPLALRIAAAHLVTRPGRRIADLISAMANGNRLSTLDASGGDPHASVRAAFGLSYGGVDAAARRLFRRLGLVPGPDVTADAAAALVDGDTEQTARHLNVLATAHLIEEHASGRYRLHDLLRLYAIECAATEESEPDSHAALGRLLDWYVGTAEVAAELLYPRGPVGRPSFAPLTDVVAAVADRTQAASWLDVELANLLAAAERAVGGGWPAHTCRLSHALWRHLDTRAQRIAAFTLHRHALGAARQAGDRQAEAQVLNSLGLAEIGLGRHAAALHHLEHALVVARQIDDPASELRALANLGGLYGILGRSSETIDHLRDALRVATETGHQANQAITLGNRGALFHGLGRLDEAIDDLRRSLGIARKIGRRDVVVFALSHLGQTQLKASRDEQAIEHQEEALRIARETRNRSLEPHVVAHLGNAYRHAGRFDEALTHHGEALTLARQHGDRDAEFEALQGTAETVYDLGRLDEAIAQFVDALEIARLTHQPHNEARAFDGVAQAQRALGHTGVARRHWERALDIVTALGTSDADRIRGHLATLDRPAEASPRS